MRQRWVGVERNFCKILLIIYSNSNTDSGDDDNDDDDEVDDNIGGECDDNCRCKTRKCVDDSRKIKKNK